MTKNRNYRRIIAFFLCGAITLLACSNNLFGGLGIFDGSDEKAWGQFGSTVVIGIIKDIKEKDQHGNCVAILVPQATIAGHFDVAVHASIKIEFQYDVGSVFDPATVSKRPNENDIVMVVMDIMPKDDQNNEEFGDVLSRCRCTFMPEDCSMIVVKGLDDPVINETLHRIQNVRIKPMPYPELEKKTTPPATQPTSKPSATQPHRK